MSSAKEPKMEKKEKKSKEKKEKKDKKSKTPEATATKSAPPSAAATPALAGGVTPGGPTATGAREPQAGEQSVVDGLLTVRVIPECPYVLKGITSTLPVVVELVTGERADRKARAPLSLAIVLDRSGSMSGAKLKESKHAVAEVIRNLSAGDVVHFIVYDTNVEVVFENGNPKAAEDLCKLVDAVGAGSSTFLSGGLEKGGEILKKNLKPGHLNKIFIFSDGLANHGLTEDSAIFALTKKIHESGIATSAFGIGADFNEATMRGIAEHGSGHYFYLNEPGNIPKYVSKALNDSLMVLGTDTVLKLRGRGAATVKQVYDHPDLVKGAQLRDLREANLRQITCVLSVTPTGTTGAEEEILAWELSYNTAEKTTKTVKGGFAIKFTDNDKLLATKNDEVTVAVAMQEASAKDVQVTELVNQGKFDEAYLLKGLSLEALRDVVAKDKKGFVAILIKRAESHMADIKARKDPARIAKSIGYDGYLARRASLCAMTEIAIASDNVVEDADRSPSPPPAAANPRRNMQRRLS